MSMLATAIQVGERLPLPDFVTRAAITRLVGSTRAKLAAADAEAERRFAEAMVEFPIAEQVEAANRQHYEVPAAFFGLVLGPRRKYSCCLYPRGDETLAEAESELGVSDWIDPDSGQLAEGQSKPHLSE